jgi:hypothetical protein
MLWIMIDELIDILRPVVKNMQDATQVLKENADMGVRRTTNEEKQYMRVRGNTSRPISFPSLKSVELYPRRDWHDPPPDPTDAELEYISSAQEDTQSRSSRQSVREVSQKGPGVKVPIRAPFPSSDLLDKHMISDNFKCRHVVVNPLRDCITPDGTREVVQVDQWILEDASPQRNAEDIITVRAIVHARVVFCADGTMGYRACGWEDNHETVLGDSDMAPIYHAITDRTTLGRETAECEPHWIKTVYEMLESQEASVSKEDYPCPSGRGISKENYTFTITKRWGNIQPTRTSDRASNHGRMGSFYTLRSNEEAALEDLAQLFHTPKPRGPMDRDQEEAGPSV